MTDESETNERTLELAIEIASILQNAGHAVALVGAGALAVHGYPRATEDLDLGTFTTEPQLLARLLREKLPDALEVRFHGADDLDPRGGVITVTGERVDPV